MAASGSDAPNDAKPSGIRYAYMFEPNKSPTAQLDALLRAIAAHIVSSLAARIAPPSMVSLGTVDTNRASGVQCRDIGDKNEMFLTPEKLAAFYKTVGGNYDGKPVSRSTAYTAPCAPG